MDFQKASELDPKYVQARLNKAVVYLDCGDYKHARAELESAVEIDPNDAEAQVALGVASRGDGKLDLARKAYERALDIEPDYPPALYEPRRPLHGLRQGQGKGEGLPDAVQASRPTTTIPSARRRMRASRSCNDRGGVVVGRPACCSGSARRSPAGQGRRSRSHEPRRAPRQDPRTASAARVHARQGTDAPAGAGVRRRAAAAARRRGSAESSGSASDDSGGSGKTVGADGKNSRARPTRSAPWTSRESSRPRNSSTS